MRPQQKTIAVLTDHISFMSEGYEGRLRRTFHTSCHARGLNLLLLYGRALDEPHPSCAAHNAIFELLDPELVQGVIMVSSLLSAACGSARLAEFAKRYEPFASCSVGVALPGMPSVEIDNRPGMEAVVEHLIVKHGRRKLAFIEGYRGQPENQERVAAYRAVLERHGIAYDPALVAQGEFVKHRGYSAMEELLARGVEMDAVVCANDAMATGAIAALARSGRRVPHDLPVTGFDDLTYARLGNPPLTTVAQPLEKMAELALDLVLEQCAGREVPARSVLDTSPIFRASCGCLEPTRRGPSLLPRASERTPADFVRAQAPLLRGELVARLAALRGDAAAVSERILDALALEAEGRSGPLLTVVDDVLEAALDDAGGERHRGLHDAMTFLRMELGQLPSSQFAALWHEIDRRILVAATVALFKQRIDLDYNYQQLVGAGERVSISLELDAVGPALQQCLPATGIRSAFLARFTDASRTRLQPFCRLVDGQLRDASPSSFPARQLLPAEAYELTATTLAVFPMAAEAACLGVAAFEYSENVIGYQLLRDQVSAALQRVLLHREVLDKTVLHERSLQERLVATERMQALRVLAGGVAHDLNNALGPLVALPDIMLPQLAELSGDPEVIRDLRADVEGIKAATLHAAQTIKDLLTLSRQGRTPKVALDLNQAVSSCLSGGTARFVPDANSGVRLIFELYPGELAVVASQAHLVRAVANLVHNAVDAIPGKGQVMVRTEARSLHDPHRGHETIPPGDYAVVIVSDTGEGFDVSRAGRLFEPFFSTKVVRDHSGTGLGLAIVHGVVKEHEGFIDVASAPGKGTSFALYFPRSTEAPAVAEASPSRRHQRARILMVDDDPAQLRTARRVLMHYGYEVDTLPGGRQTIEIFDRMTQGSGEPYALVILDMHLGGDSDGLTVLQHIRQRCPNQKAIMVSGHAPDDRIALALEARIPWLAKPYTADALAAIVRDTLTDRPSVPVVRISSKPPALTD